MDTNLSQVLVFLKNAQRIVSRILEPTVTSLFGTNFAQDSYEWENQFFVWTDVCKSNKYLINEYVLERLLLNKKKKNLEMASVMHYANSAFERRALTQLTNIAGSFESLIHEAMSMTISSNRSGLRKWWQKTLPQPNIHSESPWTTQFAK